MEWVKRHQCAFWWVVAGAAWLAYILASMRFTLDDQEQTLALVLPRFATVWAMLVTVRRHRYDDTARIVEIVARCIAAHQSGKDTAGGDDDPHRIAASYLKVVRGQRGDDEDPTRGDVAS